MRRFVSGFGVAIAMVLGGGGAEAAGRCADLSYAEQGACWKQLLAAQTRQMRQLVEARIAKTPADDLNDRSKAEAYAQILRRGQSAWEVYRDIECSHLDLVMRRHIQEAIDNCRADLNQARIAQLRAEVGH